MSSLAKEEARVRLEELAELAEACRQVFLAYAESRWDPVPESPAALARPEIIKTDPATNSGGVTAGFDLVSEVIVTYLEVAANHLGGIAALYRSGEVMFSPVPLVRSVLEYSSHAAWVIGDGTGVAEDVLARAYLEEFTSCEFAKMAAGRMGSKNDPSYIKARDRWAEVRNRAIAAFPGTTAADLDESKPGRTISNQTLPNPEAAVTWMLSLIYRKANGSVTNKQGQGIYAFLSSGTHPSLYQARQLRNAINTGDSVKSVLSVDTSYLENLLGVAVMAFYNALSYVVSFYGLGSEYHAVLTEKIDAVLPGRLS